MTHAGNNKMSLCPPRSPSAASPKVLSLCGIGMLAFQLLIYPWLSKRIGVTRSQRWACLLSIPVFVCFPFLSRLRGSEVLLVVGSVLGNFLSNVTATAVRGARIQPAILLPPSVVRE